MQNRPAGLVLLGIGLLLAVAALFSDLILSGAGRNPGFGLQQILVLIVGLGIAVAGWLLARDR